MYTYNQLKPGQCNLYYAFMHKFSILNGSTSSLPLPLSPSLFLSLSLSLHSFHPLFLLHFLSHICPHSFTHPAAIHSLTPSFCSSNPSPSLPLWPPSYFVSCLHRNYVHFYMCIGIIISCNCSGWISMVECHSIPCTEWHQMRAVGAHQQLALISCR